VWGSFVYFEGVFFTVLYWLFIACIVVQCGYALYFFTRIFSTSRAKHRPETKNLPPVSVIICAKNEAANLRANLPAIMAQRYANATGKPQYEVIVVNDASTDDTATVLKELEQKYDNLWDVSIAQEEERTLPGKKFALSKAMQYVKNDLLIMIDADCAPVSENWLQEMARPLVEGKDIVAGYGGFYAGEGWLNKFIRCETVHTFLQYSSYAKAGMPYMAVGRNMGCRKEAFLKAQNDERWAAIPSGDDDLLVNISGNAENIAIVHSRDSFTRSRAKGSFNEWVRQKQRHVSTAKYYKKGVIALLTVYAATQAACWLFMIALLFSAYAQTAVLLMAVRCIIYWSIFIATAHKLGEKKLSWFMPVFDFGWMLYNFAFSPFIIWKNKQQWK
jgi:glycosyltransferase involved in cell wall biosynthesis